MSETRDIISIADIKAIRIKCQGENCTAEQLVTPTRFYRGILQERCPECQRSRDSRLTTVVSYVCEAIQAIQKMESEGTPGENHQSTIRFEVIPPHTRDRRFSVTQSHLELQ